jgi:hypothetical protein
MAAIAHGEGHRRAIWRGADKTRAQRALLGARGLVLEVSQRFRVNRP